MTLFVFGGGMVDSKRKMAAGHWAWAHHGVPERRPEGGLAAHYSKSGSKGRVKQLVRLEAGAERSRVGENGFTHADHPRQHRYMIPYPHGQKCKITTSFTAQDVVVYVRALAHC